MDTITDWQIEQITRGSDESRYHSHAYYDIPVFDSSSRYITGHRVDFEERQPEPDEAVEIGYIDLEGGREWLPVGESRAWSWQQGAMSQWLPGTKTLIWNDRDDSGAFVARSYNVESKEKDTLTRPVYAVDPNGQFALSLNMGRLDYLRPGYGYPEGQDAYMDSQKPKHDGIWKIDMKTGKSSLVLSLRDAVRFYHSRLSWKHRLKRFFRGYIFWFNHVKISPDGKRFTVKLRYRSTDLSKGWSARMGMSLTGNIDGSDLHLVDEATSHVIWLDPDHLYCWQENGVYLYRDTGPEGTRVRQMAPTLIDHNVHIRKLPGAENIYLYDTPYREEIDLCLFNEQTEENKKIASFENHTPERGLFRCDLHPVPSPDGQKILVTSMDDGGRQIYLVTPN